MESAYTCESAHWLLPRPSWPTLLRVLVAKHPPGCHPASSAFALPIRGNLSDLARPSGGNPASSAFELPERSAMVSYTRLQLVSGPRPRGNDQQPKKQPSRRPPGCSHGSRRAIGILSSFTGPPVGAKPVTTFRAMARPGLVLTHQGCPGTRPQMSAMMVGYTSQGRSCVTAPLRLTTTA